MRIHKNLSIQRVEVNLQTKKPWETPFPITPELPLEENLVKKNLKSWNL